MSTVLPMPQHRLVSWRQTLTPYIKEAKYDFLLRLRRKGYVFSTVFSPIMFYLFFGIAIRLGGAREDYATYLLAGYGCFGVIGVALNNFGISVAAERGYGWYELKQSTPMPPYAYVLGKVIASLMFSIIIVLLLMLAGVTLGHVRMAPAQFLQLMLAFVLGMIPFCSMGMLLGLVIGRDAAGGIIHLIYLPMSFTAGLWLPLKLLPSLFQTIAWWTPAYHFAQLTLRVVGADESGDAWVHWIWLLCFTVACQIGTFILVKRSAIQIYK